MPRKKRPRPADLARLLDEAAKLRENTQSVIQRVHALEEQIHRARATAKTVYDEAEIVPPRRRRRSK
ncbi:MAG TPA: hypothetical protein VH518_09945 [Tepidisphaeraceae bacterium]|jgi:hypothetical protein